MARSSSWKNPSSPRHPTKRRCSSPRWNGSEEIVLLLRVPQGAGQLARHARIQIVEDALRVLAAEEGVVLRAGDLLEVAGPDGHLRRAEDVGAAGEAGGETEERFLRKRRRGG